MFAAGRSRAGWLTVGAGAAAALLAGCGSVPLLGGAPPQIEPGLVQASAPGGNPDRPAFFVQWKNSLPGLTKRPSIDPSTTMPAYPASAVRNGDTGVTSLESCLTVEGRLVDTHITKSSGSKVLDEATLEWTKTAKYQPAEFNGEPFAICGYRFDYEWRVVDNQR